MFVDTHTHLFSESFDEDRTAVVERAINANVEYMLLPNIDVASIEGMHQLEQQFPEHCFAMMGLHPGYVAANWEKDLEIVRTHLFQRKYVAVGEIGMDLYWDKTFIEEQKQVFTQQVEWAKELGIPIAIHAREAFVEIFEILDAINDDRLTGVFHCFTGTQSDAEHIKSYGGFKLGIGGVLTYKKSGLDAVLKNIALEELILETDAPYLSPVPFRGKRNESSYLVHIAEKLTEVYDLPLSEIAKQTTKNAIELFHLPQKQSTASTQIHADKV